MNRKLNWVKEAFSLDVHIMQDGQLIGDMRRNLFSHDVEASLNGVHLRFDVEGFLNHSVTVYDSKVNDTPIGHIELRFGKQAELKLSSGQTYLWKRHNMLMREWDMIRESPNGLPEKEIVNYDITRKFFEDAGDIVVDKEEKSPIIEVVILTGLFIRNYFQRRRRLVAIAS
ncbi:hypothetical protein [Spirosoma spitsbergense]|jgi:hypothetical protein|uniref:hypothetical protein n=1 Tax=Spirosoma spitsbergense TaxID=431554 RepID=UPI0003761DF6|nr:hypothetical protein [Spirosoma spitsbergense]